MKQIKFFIYGKVIFFVIALLMIVCPVSAQTVTMPTIIGNNMVLQQNTQAPIWGYTTAGTSVTVGASWGQSATTVSNASGKWMVKLPTPIALPGQAPTYTITITGPTNTITYSNILVGEVWLCSGQSNMQYTMNTVDSQFTGVVDYANEIASANYPNIRLFYQPIAAAYAPATTCAGSWAACSPTSVANFSAVGYYFGRELYNNPAVNVPIGLVQAAYFGSGIQCWIKDSVLRADASLKTYYVDKVVTAVTSQTSRIYNAMIAPLIPFAIKGAIWYQGESNGWDGLNYQKAIIGMVKDWRASFCSNFSFYAVQVAPRITDRNAQVDLHDTISNKGFFHEYQSSFVNNTACIGVAIQAGATVNSGVIPNNDFLLNKTELLNSHPKDKRSVGRRISLMALAKDYSQSIQYLGPQYSTMKIEGSKIRISFKSESLGMGLATKDGASYLTEFRISSSKSEGFYPAYAVIDSTNNTVVVSSPFVTAPVAVRYAFTDGAMPNLRNKDGIAAYPFRTDNWTQYDPVSVFFNLLIPLPNLTVVDAVNSNSIVSVFPNPFQAKLSFSGCEVGIKQLDIYDFTGKKIKTVQTVNPMNVDLSTLSNGVYLFKVLKGDNTVVDFKGVKK